MTRIIKRSLYLFLLLCLATGCESFLDEKPDKKQVVPTTLADFQALLDRHNIMNSGDPGAGEVSADNYYLAESDWSGLTKEEYRRMYIWEKDNLFSRGSNEWDYAYTPVYTANLILEHMEMSDNKSQDQAKWNNVRGQALFVRAKAFLQVAGIWAQAYDQNTAAAEPGIPLRTSTDFNARSERASLQETYEKILLDLKESASLLPDAQVHPLRPSRAAAYALLARTYLYMRQYPEVEMYADSSLQIFSTLQNYNTLDPKAAFPFQAGSNEISYRSYTFTPAPLYPGTAKIDSLLYKSYASDDLRKKVFFRDNGNGTFGFKGSYQGNSNLFSGMATDEVYLMRAEARARQGKVERAMEDLNTLLVTRWRTGTFVHFEAASQEDAIKLILIERRKELLMRGLRWMDIKRLNKEGANMTLTRVLNGKTFTLPPHDLRYALPLPEDVIELSGMAQNPR